MDDEQYSCGNRNPLPQTPAAIAIGEKFGNLSGLSRVEGLHVSSGGITPDLSQKHRADVFPEHAFVHQKTCVTRVVISHVSSRRGQDDLLTL